MAQEVARRFSGAILEQDRFFVDPDRCLPDSNFCDPQFLFVDEFVDAVCRLSEGLAAEVPRTDVSTFRRTGQELLDPRGKSLVVVEGMTVLRFDDVLTRFNRSYYLKASVATILSRKIRRDVTERGKTPAQVRSQMEWISSEIHVDERSLGAGGPMARCGTVPVDAEDISSAIEAICQDLSAILEPM